MVANVGRIFVAVPVEEEARHLMAAALGAIDFRPPGRPVPPENWHLTLRFLGWIDEVSYDRLLGSLDQAELGERFEMRFGELGAFPNAKRARVVWVGVNTGAEQLDRLARDTEEAIEEAGFSPEDRPFRAHLTLSRLRPPAPVQELVDNAPSISVRAPVGRVVVYRSHLGSGGARYEELESFDL